MDDIWQEDADDDVNDDLLQFEFEIELRYSHTYVTLAASLNSHLDCEDSDLRPRIPKQPKTPPSTNAERYRKYKENIKNDPLAFEEYKEKKKLHQHRWLAKLSEDEKQLQREKAHLRQQKSRFQCHERHDRTQYSLKSDHNAMFPLARKSDTYLMLWN